MKQRLLKALLFILYLLFMLIVLDYNIMLIINLRMFLFVVIGAVILTLGNLVAKITPEVLYKKLQKNIVITGCITTFLSEISNLSTNVPAGALPQTILSNMLPLLYMFILLLLTDILFVRYPKQKSEIRPPQDYDLSMLTKREQAIAQLVIENASNKVIADTLFISENTVKKHLQNIYKKAGVKNRTAFKYWAENNSEQV